MKKWGVDIIDQADDLVAASGKSGAVVDSDSGHGA
jgi:hypothetical protein